MAEQPTMAVQDYLKAIHRLGGAEHVVSPAEIAEHLGEPQEDPHGHLIPSANGELLHRNLQRLSEFRSGQRVAIREVQDDNPDRLRHWQSLGFTPGATVTILSFQPLDDIFEVQV